MIMTTLPANIFKDNKVRKMVKGVKKLGQDDPRRVIHSLKMGLALTLVSFIYYLRPLYDGFGVSGIWAVLTVVVVFEFTVGATLSKSINRGCGTVAAAGLGVGAQHLANLCGERGEPVIIGLLVFVLATAATFTRFFPKIKARYDYGVVIFILTFSLVAVSGYRVEDIFVLGYQRLFTILIGNAICMVISIFVCPVWAGQDLHRLIGNNLDSLASFLEGFGDEYFKVVDGKDAGDDNRPAFLHKYRAVLASKHTEDTLANFARWEPGHGRFRLAHPWKQYQRVGALIRQCAYRVDALGTGYISSDIKASSEFRGKIEGPCRRISAETSKALKAMSSALKTMSLPKSADRHVYNAKEAVTELETILKQKVSVLLYDTHLSKSKEDDDDDKTLLLSIIPDATIASILSSVVQCVEDIAEATHQLAESACFSAVEPTVSPAGVEPATQHVFHRGIVKPVDCDHHVGRVSIMIHDPAAPPGKAEAAGEAVGHDQYDRSCTDYERNVEGCGLVRTSSMLQQQQQQHVITLPR